MVYASYSAETQMIFKLQKFTTVKDRVVSQNLKYSEIQYLVSSGGRFTLVWVHNPSITVCDMFFRYKIPPRFDEPEHTGNIYPHFRIADGDKMTAMLLMAEFMGYLQYIPEGLGIQNFRHIIRSIAKHYGKLENETRPYVRVTADILAKKSIMKVPTLEIVKLQRILEDADE